MVRRTLTTGGSRLNAGPPRLFFLTDLSRVPDPAAAAMRLPRGAGIVLRDAGHPDRARIGVRLGEIARRRGLFLLVSGDEALAARLKADGLHLPEAEVSRAPAIRRRRPRWLMTGAAHSRRALFRARAFRLDMAFLSPVFPTQSHEGAPALGPLRFRAMAAGAGIPVVALGGIDGRTAGRLPPVAGIAAIGALAAGMPAPFRRRCW